MDELLSEKLSRVTHVRIFDAIKQDYVCNSKFHAGKLPSEAVLCGKYGTSRSTVRKALDLLAAENLIYKVRGSGTFIKSGVTTGSGSARAVQVALILQGIDGFANSKVLEGVKSIFDSQHIGLEVYLTYNKLSEERKCLKKILRRSVNGVIVEGVHANVLNTNLDNYYALENNNIPVIFYNNYYRNTDFPKIIMDDMLSADLLIKKLTENGHRRIAGIFMYDNYQGVEKYTGFIKALIKYGAVCDDRYVKWYGTDERETSLLKKSLWQFIKRLKQCTAIVCCNRVIKDCLLELLVSHGKSVPADFSLAAFDCQKEDCEISKVFSSIHPSYEIGREAAKKIMLMMRNIPAYKQEEYSVTFSPRIYDGASVKNLSAGSQTE